MPLILQQDISPNTKLAVWKIDEDVAFFQQNGVIPLPISHPVKQLQHLAGRFLLTFLFPDFPITDIVILPTRKPVLLHQQYHFSISHCTNYAAAIVSKTNSVGVDVETITERVLKIQHKFLNEKELLFLAELNRNTLIKQLTVLWSAKEAMYKWWGSGDISFKEVLQTRPFSCKSEGIINADFIHNDLTMPLTLNYRTTDELSLVWVESAFN